ncbi:thioredoxin reductase [Halorubrum sp. BOL3-1]|uniref:FAD/NAD(P)-binding protein n=1 Tax=Halorubrum sp. BOL3-1 TaxID=2497325 RepID=UPI0010051459|nr:FAD/NAD(P)-binding protein [Halorubrum sp. BOL3-1]QAU12020.1 thioredoxin reductase [Halorubrum sp. BOL3-1]
MTTNDAPGERLPIDRQPYEYVIVGGGIHGACLTNYLLTEGEYTHDEIRILDPREELLTSFAKKARQCGMETLRSTFVHHIGIEPFSLESFAEEAGREGELVSTESYPDRPTLDLFLDHARDVVDRHDLDDCHHQSRVTDVTRSTSQEAYLVETDTGTIEAHRVVLSVGLGATPTLPRWTTSLSDDAPLAHVWDDGFDPTTTDEFEGRTFVVGGGITAGQFACRLAERTDVTLLSRHELDIELTEADPYWINWRHIGEEIHTLPPGSEARLDRIRAARNDATIPPYVERRLTEACDDGALKLRRGEITSAHATDQGLSLRFDDGKRATAARVVLATGLEPVPDQPLVERVSGSLSLARGAEGFPVLDDRTLAWRRTDGTESAVYVSGALAEPSVGPFARNIVGARRAAERILDPPDQTRADSLSVSSRGGS